MARRKTAAQAKEAKQKKIAIGLAVVFVAVAAIQVPKLMKQLSAKPPAVAAAPAPAATAAGGAQPAPATPAPAPTSAALVTQLHNFSHLPIKDPFHALIAVPKGSTGAAGAPAPAAAAAKATVKAKAATKAKATATKAKAQAKAAAAAQAAADQGVTGTVGFTAAAPPNAAIVQTNGKKQVVFVGDGFPTAEPLFKLVALGDKTVRLGVLGGSFASGIPTIKIAKGKQVTLANQSDGSHYVIKLVKLTTATPPVEATASTPTSTTPAPATTTTG